MHLFRSLFRMCKLNLMKICPRIFRFYWILLQGWMKAQQTKRVSSLMREFAQDANIIEVGEWLYFTRSLSYIMMLRFIHFFVRWKKTIQTRSIPQLCPFFPTVSPRPWLRKLLATFGLRGCGHRHCGISRPRSTECRRIGIDDKDVSSYDSADTFPTSEVGEKKN